MVGGGVVRIGVSLPPKLLEEFDELISNMKYESRSKAVHDAIRSFITENKWMYGEGESAAGAVVMIYYYDRRSLLKELAEIQNEYSEVISSTTRIPIGDSKFLEIIAVVGDVGVIRSLTQKLMIKRGVKQLKVSLISL